MHQNLPDSLPFLSPNPPTYLFRPRILSAPLLPQWADFRLLPSLSLLAQPRELFPACFIQLCKQLLQLTGHVFSSGPSPPARRMSPRFEWHLRPSVSFIQVFTKSYICSIPCGPAAHGSLPSDLPQIPPDSRLVTACAQLPQRCPNCPSSSVSQRGAHCSSDLSL